MFRIIILIIATTLAFAETWVHYSGQGEVRDAVKTSDGTTWAAMAWGIQELAANGKTTFYTPGNKGLETADFVQIFALPKGDVMAVSRNGVLVRKDRSSNKFETANISFMEKKRNLEPALGKIADNILILPFNGALAFFDHSTNRSVATLLQIGTSSLEEYKIKRVAVRNDSIWVDLDSLVWKRRINWNEIHKDYFLTDPMSWIEVKEIPFEEEHKISAQASSLNNFHLERVKSIALNGNSAIAWGNNYDRFAKMRNDEWGWDFRANKSGYNDDQNNYVTKSLALYPDGNFAAGMWGPGLLIFGNGFPEAELKHWFHSNNTNNECPTEWSNAADAGWTIVQGLVLSPDFYGYVFSYASEKNYGIGFVDNNGKTHCLKSDSASSSVAFSIIVRENKIGEWEIYASWRASLESERGGVDFYKVSTPKNFNPVFIKKWEIPFGAPVDLAFDSQGILWAASLSKIFYLNEREDEWKEPSYIRGFNGGTISALETDAQNGLWLGTLGDGAYSFSQVNNSPDSLIAKQYKIKTGLLNETVYDIAIDTIKGRVYFANDLGLSVYHTTQVRNSQNYMQSGSPPTIAYPNPFRPKEYSAVTISNISEKSSVYILDSFGKRVRLFKGGDLKGGAVRWDGTNERGHLVAPGLYHYVAADGKNTVKGKIIVER